MNRSDTCLTKSIMFKKGKMLSVFFLSTDVNHVSAKVFL